MFVVGNQAVEKLLKPTAYMSVSPQLQASARAAYRSIFRASGITFAGELPGKRAPDITLTQHVEGDPEIRRAFALKTRGDFIAARSETNEVAYAESVKFANEIATVLRTNLVQGRLRDDGVYDLRMTPHTELGSNESIKNPPKLERPSRARRRAREEAAQAQKESSSSVDNTSSLLSPSATPAAVSLNFSALKKASRQREVPVLNEDDLEETFIKGRGPGGQCINKRSTNVDLLHKPSGIRVKCQETRSLQDNRRIARKLIIKKLDTLLNPGMSKEEVRDARVRERKRRKVKKSKKKASQADEKEDDFDNGGMTRL